MTDQINLTRDVRGLRAVVETLTALTGPNRYADAAVCVALIGPRARIQSRDPITVHVGSDAGQPPFVMVPCRYTESRGAVLRVIEDNLPGATWSTGCDGRSAWASLSFAGEDFLANEAGRPNEAIALLIAALRAIIRKNSPA